MNGINGENLIWMAIVDVRSRPQLVANVICREARKVRSWLLCFVIKTNQNTGRSQLVRYDHESGNRIFLKPIAVWFTQLTSATSRLANIKWKLVAISACPYAKRQANLL